MSTDDKTTPSSLEVCASCGIAEVDEEKLKTCDGGCNLAKYCNDVCQENHKKQHDEECKTRKAELHDKQLFSQPDISHRGECPICCLPLLIDPGKSALMGCCCKVICRGCDYANKKREHERGLQQRCTFCRNPAPKSDEEYKKNIMERVKKNDPVAMAQMGKEHETEGDYGKALKYYTNAAELGDADAHCCLGFLYYSGDDVEKDTKKAVYHWEQAAIGGHPNARSILANYEKNNGSFDRAAKHLIINANLGCERSVKMIKDLFIQGVVSKEGYAAALRAYQAAVDATKSVEREKAEAYFAAREARRLDSQPN
jgi:tetratricopeptide (TPR) repeat protein